MAGIFSPNMHRGPFQMSGWCMVLYSGKKILQNLAKLVGITPDPNNINLFMVIIIHFFFQKKWGRKNIKHVPVSTSWIVGRKETKNRGYDLCKTYFSLLQTQNIVNSPILLFIWKRGKKVSPGTYMLPLFYDEEFLGVLNVRGVS